MFWISILTTEVKIMGSFFALILCYMADILILDNFTHSRIKTVQFSVWSRDWCKYVSILFPPNDKKKNKLQDCESVFIVLQCYSNLTSTQKTRNFKVNKYNAFIFMYLFYICVCAHTHTHTHTHTHIYWSKHFQKTRKRLLLFDKKEGKGMDCSKYSLVSTE